MSYEWVRPRTVRLTWWLAAVSVAATALAACAYSAVILGMVKSGAAVDGLEAVVVVGSKASVAPVVAAVLGVFAVGNDYRYGTMCTTLLVTPRRGVALAAKAATVAAFGAALAVVAWSVGHLVLGDRLSLAASPAS